MSVAESQLHGTQKTPNTEGQRSISEFARDLTESTAKSISSFKSSLNRIKDSAFSITARVPHRGVVGFALVMASATLLTPIAVDAMGFGPAAEARRAAADEDAKYHELYQQVVFDAFGDRFGPTVTLGRNHRLGMPDLATFVTATEKDRTYDGRTITSTFPFNLRESQTLATASPVNIRLYFREGLLAETGDFQKVVIHTDLTPTLGDPESVEGRVADLQRLLGNGYEYGLGQVGKSRDPEPAATAVLRGFEGQKIVTATLTQDGVFNYDRSYRAGLSQ